MVPYMFSDLFAPGKSPFLGEMTLRSGKTDFDRNDQLPNLLWRKKMATGPFIPQFLVYKSFKIVQKGIEEF